MWHSAGSELFYVNGAREIVSVDVATEGPVLSIGESRVFFLSPWRGSLNDAFFNVTADGQLFLFVRPVQTPVPVTPVLARRAGLER